MYSCIKFRIAAGLVLSTLLRNRICPADQHNLCSYLLRALRDHPRTQIAILNNRLKEDGWNFTNNCSGSSSAPLDDITKQTLPVATDTTTRCRHRQGKAERKIAHNHFQTLSQTCEHRQFASTCLSLLKTTELPMDRFSCKPAEIIKIKLKPDKDK